jgi:histidine triad (HIT) family protein
MSTLTPSGCAFCLISAGSVTTPSVYESATVIAFFPLRPAALGHTLVVPRQHADDLWDLEAADAPPLMEAVLRIAHAIRDGLRPDGLNVIVSAGAAASQTIRHLHVHLVPRWVGDNFGGIWPRHDTDYGDDRIEQTANRIQEALKRGPGAGRSSAQPVRSRAASRRSR